MPRDLLADKRTLDEMPQLSREVAATQQPDDSSPMPLYSPSIPKEERFQKMGEIHPFAQLLNVEDLDDCDWLEHAAFDPIEAATREKVSLSIVRLRHRCPVHLSIFTAVSRSGSVRHQPLRPSPFFLLPKPQLCILEASTSTGHLPVLQHYFRHTTVSPKCPLHLSLDS